MLWKRINISESYYGLNLLNDSPTQTQWQHASLPMHPTDPLFAPILGTQFGTSLQQHRLSLLLFRSIGKQKGVSSTQSSFNPLSRHGVEWGMSQYQTSCERNSQLSQPTFILDTFLRISAAQTSICSGMVARIRITTSSGSSQCGLACQHSANRATTVRRTKTCAHAMTTRSPIDEVSHKHRRSR